MKATFQREGLLAAFQIGSTAVTTKDVKPILRNLKLIADGERATLMATDLELGIRLEIRGVKVKEEGDAILPAQQTMAILRESTDEQVHLDCTNERCVLSGDVNEFEMPSDDPAHFPDVAAFSEEKYHEIPAGSLRTMIKRTIFAVAKENPRYALTGVLWELEDKLARLVATDGRRLAMTECAAAVTGGHETKGQTPVVPTKAMSILERNLQDDAESVWVSMRPNDVLFRTPRAVICSRLVEGRFPAYREVFPKKATVKVPLVCGPFYTAVRQSAIMTDDETKKVMFQFGKKKLTLQARGAETGRAKIELPIDYDGKNVDICFDPMYLADMLRVLDSKAELTLELVDGNSPALFRHGEDYWYIAMPLTEK